MKPNKDRRIKPDVRTEDLRPSHVAVGTLLLVSLIYAVTIIN
jgi:hypothetical protein